MKEVFEQNSEQKKEGVLGKEERELLIENIKQEDLDPDTKKNARFAVLLFSVGYNDAIKIAETVNLLWEGNKRFEDESKNEKYSFKTPYDDVFIKKIFPIAKEYKDAETINDIPKEVLEDVFKYKTDYNNNKVLSELEIYVCNDEKKIELYNFVKQKMDSLEKGIAGEDSEWNEIIEKLDRQGIDIMSLKENKSILIDIIKALLAYERKQNKIKERYENGFEVKGFENSEIVSNEEIKKFMFDAFGRECLAKSLISEVFYFSKFAISGKNLNDTQESMYINEDEYINLEKEVSDLEENRRFLGGSRTDGVITIYNHKHRDASCYKELKRFLIGDKSEALFLGTVTHEMGHRFYYEILKLSEREQYDVICLEMEIGYVTEYVKKRNGDPGEDFADSMKRFMTDYEDFKREFPKRVEFIESKFPEIVNDGIRKFIESKQ